MISENWELIYIQSWKSKQQFNDPRIYIWLWKGGIKEYLIGEIKMKYAMKLKIELLSKIFLSIVLPICRRFLLVEINDMKI